MKQTATTFTQSVKKATVDATLGNADHLMERVVTIAGLEMENPIPVVLAGKLSRQENLVVLDGRLGTSIVAVNHLTSKETV